MRRQGWVRTLERVCPVVIVSPSQTSLGLYHGRKTSDSCYKTAFRQPSVPNVPHRLALPWALRLHLRAVSLDPVTL